MLDDARPELHRLIYISRVNSEAVEASPLAAFRSILDVSNANNARHNITGVLLFDGLNFVQVLEGDRRATWRLFERIRADVRHLDVQLIEFVAREQRQFSEWSMAGSLRTPVQDRLYARHGFEGRLQADAIWPERLIPLAQDVVGIRGNGPGWGSQH